MIQGCHGCEHFLIEPDSDYSLYCCELVGVLSDIDWNNMYYAVLLRQEGCAEFIDGDV